MFDCFCHASIKDCSQRKDLRTHIFGFWLGALLVFDLQRYSSEYQWLETRQRPYVLTKTHLVPVFLFKHYFLSIPSQDQFSLLHFYAFCFQPELAMNQG